MSLRKRISPHRRRSLTAESLENRRLLAGDLTLDGDGNLVFSDTTVGGQADQLLIVRAGDNLTLSDPANTFTSNVLGSVVTPDGHEATIPLGSVTGGSFLLDTLEGDDAVTLDLAGGTVPLALQYAGGAGTNSLTFQGNVALADITLVDAASGAADLDGQALQFAEVTSVIASLGSDHLRVQFSDAGETIVVRRDGSLPARSIAVSTAAPSLAFSNPKQHLELLAGNGPDRDVLFLSSFGTADDRIPNLTVLGQGGVDRININLLSNLGDGAHVFDAGQQRGDAVIVGRSLGTTGAVTMAADSLIDLQASVSAGSLELNRADAIQMAGGVVLEATSGDLVVDPDSPIVLTGLAGANGLFASGNVSLGTLEDAGGTAISQLTISAGQDITVDSVTLNASSGAADDPALVIAYDTGNDDRVQSLATNRLVAGEIHVAGGESADDLLVLRGLAFASRGEIAVENVVRINFLADAEIVAQGDVDLASHLAHGQVVLTGDSGTNKISSRAGSVLAANLVDSANSAIASLIVSAGEDVVLRNVTLNAAEGADDDPSLIVKVDADGAKGQHTLSANRLIAGQIDLAGGNDLNDDLQVTRGMRANRRVSFHDAGDVVVRNAGSLDIDFSGINAARDIKLLQAGQVRLGANVTLAAARDVLATSVDEIAFVGDFGTNRITATHRNLAVGRLVDHPAQIVGATLEKVELLAGGNLSVHSALLDAGLSAGDDPGLILRVDLAANNESQSLTAGPLSAGYVNAAAGAASNEDETFVFSGVVTATHDAAFGPPNGVTVAGGRVATFTQGIATNGDVRISAEDLVEFSTEAHILAARGGVAINTPLVRLGAAADVLAQTNVSLGGQLVLTGDSGTNRIQSTSGNVQLGGVNDTPAVDLAQTALDGLVISAGIHINTGAITLNAGAGAADDPLLLLLADQTNDAVNGDLNTGDLVAGRVEIQSNSSETIDFNITATRAVSVPGEADSSILVTLFDSLFLPSNLVVQVPTGDNAPPSIAIRSIDLGKNVKLRANDNISIGPNVSITAANGGTVVIQPFKDGAPPIPPWEGSLLVEAEIDVAEVDAALLAILSDV